MTERLDFISYVFCTPGKERMEGMARFSVQEASPHGEAVLGETADGFETGASRVKDEVGTGKLSKSELNP